MDSENAKIRLTLVFYMCHYDYLFSIYLCVQFSTAFLTYSFVLTCNRPQDGLLFVQPHLVVTLSVWN